MWRDLFHRESRWKIHEEVITASEEDPSDQRKPSNTSTASFSTPRKPQSLGAQLSRSGSTTSLRSLTRSGSISERRPSITSMNSSMSLSLSLSRRSSIGSSTPRQPPSPSSSIFMRDLNGAPPSPSPSLSRSISRRPSLVSLPSEAILDLGKDISLDWTRLYKDRFALQRRWEEGRPKISWLTGHTDSVYCLQFDKVKVVSGSVCLRFFVFFNFHTCRSKKTK